MKEIKERMMIMLTEAELNKIKVLCDCSHCEKKCPAERTFKRLPSVLGGMAKCLRLRGRYK